MKVTWGYQRFSEDVCNLLLFKYVVQGEKTILNQLLNEVHVNLNILSRLMLH